MNEFFKQGFEKVAISAATARKAYSKAITKAMNLKKDKTVSLAKVKKLNEQADFFLKGIDKRQASSLGKVKAKQKELKAIRAEAKDKLRSAYGTIGAKGTSGKKMLQTEVSKGLAKKKAA